jgi:hypothetical protein
MADIADHTYGEFIDVVKAGARVVCLEAPVYIEDWATSDAICMAQVAHD